MNRRTFLKSAGVITLLPTLPLIAAPKQQWTTIAEQLPKPNTFCIVKFGKKYMMATYDEKQQKWALHVEQLLHEYENKIESLIEHNDTITIQKDHRWMYVKDALKLNKQFLTRAQVKRNTVYLVSNVVKQGNMLTLATYQKADSQMDLEIGKLPMGQLGFKDHHIWSNRRLVSNFPENDEKNTIGLNGRWSAVCYMEKTSFNKKTCTQYYYMIEIEKDKNYG